MHLSKEKNTICDIYEYIPNWIVFMRWELGWKKTDIHDEHNTLDNT